MHKRLPNQTKMLIKANKYLILIILLLLSVALSAQVARRKYVTRTGDTTVVVMTGSTGLYGEDARFLLDQKASDDFLEKRSRYNRLKDAVLETEQVAVIVGEEYKENNPNSGSLGFRAAQENVRLLQKKREADKVVKDKEINSNVSVAELAFMREKFGDKPSYFVNGVPVEASTASRIPRNSILSRELKVSNTTTGNPNGEVWMVIGAQAFDRLGLGVSYAETQMDNTQPYEDRTKLEEQPKSEYAGRGFTPEQEQRLREQEREIEDLKRAILSAGTGTKNVDNATETRVVTQKQGNKFVDLQEEIFSFRDSPQERSRRARDQKGGTGSVRSHHEDVIQVSNEAKGTFVDDNITEDTPKRSIRRIKQRQRDQ